MKWDLHCFIIFILFCNIHQLLKDKTTLKFYNQGFQEHCKYNI